jgi:hypothetical protein
VDTAKAELDLLDYVANESQLDAFGVCEGSAKYVDIAGHPCDGLLDAAGTILKQWQ